VIDLSALVPVLLTAGGGVLYHVASKSVPQALAPALVLVVAYATALGVSATAYLLLAPPFNADAPARPWHPAVIAIGLAIAMIHVGYLLMYRAAWSVSVASALTNGLVAALLVPIGIAAFGERLSTAKALGIALCLVGVVLLRR
jgi:multidrug transporter EmrE-like cation transporter